MSDAFTAVLGGQRGAEHLRAEATLPGFPARVRAMAAGMSSGEASSFTSITRFVASFDLAVVAYAMYGGTNAADGQLAMELGPAEEDPSDPSASRALLLLSETPRAGLAGGRLFLLDHEFEVAQ